ncbi:MAG: hypothetical protein IR159_07830 [Brevundimonas sp.]|nr:hypothetical protein [Brevundimonas sp.]
MKPLLIAAVVLLAAPAAAQAQVAAGSVPNTFDDPAARTQAATPAPAAPPQAALSSEPANAESEEVLRAVIGEMQAGTIDYDHMTDTLAAGVREQESVVTPLVEGFGALVAVSFAGSREDIDVFNVTFANAATQWLIGINPEGKISALLFRPAED